MTEIDARTQAVREARYELGVLIMQWWREKHPEVTTAEMTLFLAAEVESLLELAVRDERAARAGGDGDGDEEDDDA